MASIKEIGARIWAAVAERETQKWAAKPVETQEAVFHRLLHAAKDTAFGKDHGFADIKSYADFKARVPLRDYEGLRSYEIGRAHV